MSAGSKPTRVISMDQFRGYTVAGMFLVNFVGGYAAIHQVLKHNNTHFSYADSIMPSFIFCAGFSYRLTALRRFMELGTLGATLSYLKRSLALILLSVAMYTFDVDLPKSWTDVKFADFFFQFFKAGMWEVLAIIGVVQILILPLIHRSFQVRLIATVAIAALHLILSWSFNYNFLHGLDNWFNAYYGANNTRVWDGGLFGNLSWAIPMLIGTLTYDVIAHRTAPKAWPILCGVGILLMAGGYGASCLTRLYDLTPASRQIMEQARETLTAQKVEAEKITDPETKERRVAAIQKRIDSLKQHPIDPVFPSFARLKNPIALAELPFFPPPGHDQRQDNYWMMNKRIVTLSFSFFASGFALCLYSLFIPLCDIGHVQIGVFRTLGQNPLAAYIIHHMVEAAVHNLTPDDSPLWWIEICFVIFFGTTYLMVHYLEKQKLFLRL